MTNVLEGPRNAEGISIQYAKNASEIWFTRERYVGPRGGSSFKPWEPQKKAPKLPSDVRETKFIARLPDVSAVGATKKGAPAKETVKEAPKEVVKEAPAPKKRGRPAKSEDRLAA